MDGTTCSTDGHYIQLKDKSVLSVYGQEKGTGLFSITHSPVDGARLSALGGSAAGDSSSWLPEFGSFALYGGNVSVESTGYYAVNLQSLTVMGGTLSAKAVEPYSAIMVADEAPTFAENYKVCKADAPQEKTSYGNAQGVRILITECTEHDFGYAASETSGMHKGACKLCSVFHEEAHDFSFGSEFCDQMKHYLTCACGAKSVTTEYHNFVCTPNNDSLTHGTACSVCGYEKEDSSSEEHDFTSDKTLCSKCGFKRGVSIRFGDTLINREKFVDALDLAMGGSGSSTDGVITVYGDEECFPGTQITVKWGKFTIDLNGAELAFPGITLFDINRTANVTIKNGKLNLAGNTIYNDNPGIMDRSGGLTLEDVEITASCNTSNGHVQYPAVKVLFNFSNPQTFTAKNVIFNGGFEARGSASITPFTSGSFVYSCPEATHENPVIKVGKNITDIIADGYALAKYDDNTQLVSMYQYDETGARVNLNEIWESVTVVPHPEHTFTNGVCGCGYRCEHAGGFDADGICQSCGAHAVASVGDEMFTQLDVAFARANELSASTGENIKINILYDLGDTAGSGTATAKITLDLNGHDLRKCQFFVGKKDESGNVTAEGDLTILDSGELTNGQIDKVTLYGGKLAVTDGYSMDIDVYGGEAFITDHIAENIRVYGGTANLTKGSANDISVYKGELNISGSAVNRLFVNSDGKTHIFDGKITKATLFGGETTISDGRITDTTLSGGELHITNGLLSSLLVNGGKANISNDSYGTSIPTFEMKAGEVLIEGGNFDDFTVNITNAGNTNPKLEIENGTFGRTSFAAATQGRITLYGGTFDSVDIDVLPGSTVRTLGDILAENYMFYKISDRSLIPNSTDRISESAEVKRHRHVYDEKSNVDGSYYGECACGYKAEAVIEKADSSKTYYDTFEKAAAAIASGDTLKLCFDIVCENDVTIEQKGAYNSRVTLNLNGKKLSFEDGQKLNLINSYIDVTDNENGSGYVSYLYVNWSTTRLYGGSYGKLQSDNENLLKHLRGNGCGFKSLASDEWITSFDRASSLTDVAVKPAPYTVKAVVTNTPDGTETPAVIYAGQTVYFKLLFTVNSGEPEISESSPASSSLDYVAANGKSYVIGTKLPVTGSGAFAQRTLAEDAAAGTYKALFENIEYLGCLQDIDVWFEVKLCTHDSYTDGICDICGLPCKHTNVGEDGQCGTCQTEFSLQLITKDGASSYYTAFKDALIAANLEENKGSTVKLFKDVTMTQAERWITLNGGEFTLDLNGYTVYAEAKTEPTHSMLYISLTNVDMTLKTSTVRNTYTSFYPIIQIYDGTVFKSSHDFTDSYLHIDEINFAQSITTGKVSLGSGVYVVNLHKANDQMTSGEVLEDGCVFRTSYGNTIIPRSDTSTIINRMFVIKCPHDWNGDTCNYCGLVCDHPKGYVNSVCPVCGRVCDHKNLDENYYCSDCKQQMGVMIESPDAKITYIPFCDTSLQKAIDVAENGSKLTLLADVDFNAVLDQKTLTLDFNNKSVTGGWFEIGKLTFDSNYNVTDVTTGAKLILTGHSAKEDYNSSNVTERGLINVYNNNTLVMDGWSGTLGGINASRYFNADKPTIQIDNGTFCSVSLQNGTGYTLGDFLKTGYAFKYTDGSGYLSYNHELVFPDFEFFNISVVECTEHNDSDGDGMCDYCNGQIVAQVTVSNGESRVYTDFQDAVDSIDANNIHTVTLLADAVGSYTVTKGSGTTFKLNGKTLNEIAFSGKSSMAFNDRGTVNSVIFSGNTTKLNAGNPLIIINKITVRNGATWSSILPNANLHGYQVYNSDKSGYKWYDAGMLEEFLGDGNTVNNVKVQPLPVTKDPILMVDGQKIATQSSISVYKPFVFSFESWVDNGWNGSGVLFIQKEGDTAPTPVNAEGESDIYTCPERTFDISESGTYTVWAEVSKQGYTRRSKTYTLNVGADLQDTEITLKQSEFTYTPLSADNAEEFRPEIDSVKLFGHDVPADAYTVSGETTGTDARTYTMTITAKEGSDYIGSVSVNWTIHPRVLTEVGVGTHIKKYDGTTEITVDNIGKNDVPPHFFYDGCPAGGIVLKYDEDFKLGDLNANFSYPNAGEYADVSFTVELKNSNYTFKDNDSNDTKYKTVDTGMYIDKADLPTGCEPGEGGVTVRNGVAHTYTYDVSALLKQLPTGLSYGTKSFCNTLKSVNRNASVDLAYWYILQNSVYFPPRFNNSSCAPLSRILPPSIT